MRFKIDKNLARVAQEIICPADLNLVSRNLCSRFVDAGMIEDTPDNWGESVLRATGPQYVSDVCEILAGYLYGDKAHSIDSDVFRAFCRLIVVGDGNCPVCGGDLRFEMVDGCEKLDDGDYFTPPSYSDDGYFVYVCEHCWETIKSEYEL